MDIRLIALGCRVSPGPDVANVIYVNCSCDNDDGAAKHVIHNPTVAGVLKFSRA
jgi:hypothetical protein